jgi:hypothetical protein
LTEAASNDLSAIKTIATRQERRSEHQLPQNDERLCCNQRIPPVAHSYGTPVHLNWPSKHALKIGGPHELSEIHKSDAVALRIYQFKLGGWSREQKSARSQKRSRENPNGGRNANRLYAIRRSRFDSSAPSRRRRGNN